MITMREATPEEVMGKNNNTKIQTWGLIAEENGKIVGHVYLSKALGNVFGHDALNESGDPEVGTRLYLRARKKCRQWGVKQLTVHVAPESRSLPFWLSCGFTQVGILLQGNID